MCAVCLRRHDIAFFSNSQRKNLLSQNNVNRNLNMLYETAKLIIFGYIRKIQDNIPTDIKRLCTKYFYIKGGFMSLQSEESGIKFNFVYDVMKYRYLILGTNTIQRSEQSEHEWKIKTSDQYQGKIGIIDVTNQLGQNKNFASNRLNLKNGISTIWNKPNIKSF